MKSMNWYVCILDKHQKRVENVTKWNFLYIYTECKEGIDQKQLV